MGACPHGNLSAPCAQRFGPVSPAPFAPAQRMPEGVSPASSGPQTSRPENMLLDVLIQRSVNDA